MQNAVTKHYLWAIGDGIKACKPGDVIAGRYLFQGDRLLLDTKPEQLPELPEEIPDAVAPYLRLFPYRLHLPQIFGLVSPSASKLTTELWLLQNGPINGLEGRLMPELSQCWSGASAMRQLGWLWQIAQLWEPLRLQGVVSTLLHPELLRVEGPLLRLQQLELDRKTLSLQLLGKLWQQQWLPTAHPRIASFLKQLCQDLLKGQIRSSERLIHQLDQALTIGGRGQSRTVQIASGTDTGPSRSHNEDACYPPHGSYGPTRPGPEALGIVCDGIGGQEGGEVASQLAIDILSQRIQKLSIPADQMNPLRLMAELEEATCLANDAISSRNDLEQRQGRQRMGTTLVMGLAQEHELYVTHVGDSRAYWITRHGCHQVTLDDDVACREVRLGYAVYLDALQQVAAGALIQALGITASTTLHPTVQRFPIDEDCVFLLCSDGLSDRERVLEYWSTLILPILDGRADVGTVRDQLIQLANTKNGHDNVTVALMYFQVQEGEVVGEISVPPMAVTEVPTLLQIEEEFLPGEMPTESKTWQDTPKTQWVDRPPRRASPGPLLLGILVLLGLGWGMIRLLAPDLWQAMMDKVRPNSSTPEEISPLPTATESLNGSPTPGGSLVAPVSSWVAALPLRSFFQMNPNPTTKPEENQALVLWKDSEQSDSLGIIPLESVWQIVEKKTLADSSVWLQLKLCKILSEPSQNVGKTEEAGKIETEGVPGDNPGNSQAGTESIPPPLKPGNIGWISLDDISKTDIVELNSTATSQGVCTP